MHYFICQPEDASRLPFTVMTDSVGLTRLSIGLKRGEHAMQDAQRRVFGETVAGFAPLTAAEYFDTLRAARDPGTGSDGGQPAPIDPVKPKPSRPPRGGIAARMAAAGTLS